MTHQTGPEGQKVRRLLIEEGADIKKELYVGMVVDRGHAAGVPDGVLGGRHGHRGGRRAHTGENPQGLRRPGAGLQDAEADDVARKIGIPEAAVAQARKFCRACIGLSGRPMHRSPKSIR